MVKPKRKTTPERPGRTPPDSGSEPASPPRIVGGQFRGRRLVYSGDPRTRPMKERVREALFNLVGPDVVGKHAVDLFAGTGALGLEALSRGAARATFIEQHFPTAAIIRQNIESLEVESLSNVLPSSTFAWFRRGPDLGPVPWLVFCSPPYDFYVDRRVEILDMIAGLLTAAPPGSIFVVESDDRFDVQTLPQPEAWDVRRYAPAVVALLRKPRMEGTR